MALYNFTKPVWLCVVICCVALCDVTQSRFILPSRIRDSNSVDPLCDETRCRQMPINCVDAVEAEDDCCSNTLVCPDGPNCWHNGVLISGRRMQKQRDYDTGCLTICSCPPPWRVVYDSETEAECRVHCPSRRQ